MMPCYFCQSPVRPTHDGILWQCDVCPQLANSNRICVLGCEDKEGAHLYAHIFINRNKEPIYEIPSLGDKYHIRLNLQRGFTEIECSDGDGDRTPLLSIPGFPINPTNAERKLLTYLIFS